MSRKPRNAAEYLDEVSDPVSEALDKLDTRLYSVEQGVIRPLQKNHKMTEAEWEAIVYLQDEWTFLYEPEADLIAAACEYERAHEGVASEEVYSWEG
jgi:predicted metal-dependent hydrolase